jgi:drug/metabolite transporter (DMT)-like permease
MAAASGLFRFSCSRTDRHESGYAVRRFQSRPPFMSARPTAWIQIHFCVVLWGFTAILGKLITLPALTLVWWRMLIVTLALACVPRVWRGVRSLSRELIGIYAAIGIVVALHWLTFYGAIKLSNASIAATCIALAPVFLSIIEPWVARRRFNPRELLIGVLVIPGVALVIGATPNEMRLGISVGTLSAFFVAIFSAFNKRFVDRADPMAVTSIEMATGAAFLTLLMPFISGSSFVLPGVHDAWLLLMLAIGCTLLPFTLALHALRQLSAFGTQLATNLEPVYAIVLAIALFGEQRQLGSGFYLGVAIILSAILLHALIERRATRLLNGIE